jgi:hypothetical protein
MKLEEMCRMLWVGCYNKPTRSQDKGQEERHHLPGLEVPWSAAGHLSEGNARIMTLCPLGCALKMVTGQHQRLDNEKQQV